MFQLYNGVKIVNVAVTPRVLGLNEIMYHYPKDKLLRFTYISISNP